MFGSTESEKKRGHGSGIFVSACIEHDSLLGIVASINDSNAE